MSDHVAVSEPTPVIQPAEGGPVPVSPPVLMSRGPARRSKNPTHERKLVVMEWIVMGVDDEDGRGGGSLAMEFYLAKGPADADGLRSRLQALPLPDGAIDRVVHVQPARRWPLSDDELLVTLEQHKMYAAAIIAGRDAEAEQPDQEVADDGSEK